MRENPESTAAGADDENFLARPVLVYGPRKAGTTLLQSLMDGGRAMVMLPDELKLKFMERPGWPGDVPAARWFVEEGRSYFSGLFRISGDGLSVEVIPGRGLAGLGPAELDAIIDLEKYVAGLGELLRSGSGDVADLMKRDVGAFMAALRGGRGSAERWGSKEVGGDPEHVTSLFHRSFPAGNLIYLVRQPEFIARAIIMDRRRKAKRMSFRRLLHECRDAQDVVNFGYKHALAGGLVVSYEALTENTAAITGKICGEVGLPPDEVHSKPTTLGETVVVVTSSRQTTSVFRQEKEWTKDLTGREKLAVRLFQAVAPLYYRLKGRRKIRYGDLRALLAAKGY